MEESTRASMFKLRQTWSDVFPPKKLYALDVRVKSIDPAWPVTAPLPTSIHLNPAFLPKVCVVYFQKSCFLKEKICWVFYIPMRLLLAAQRVEETNEFIILLYFNFDGSSACFNFSLIVQEERVGYKPNSTKKVNSLK